MVTILCTNAYKAAESVKITKPGPFPVLNHALLYTDEGLLHIVTLELTTDGMKAKKASMTARVEQEFRTCVPMYKKTTWEEYTGRCRVKHTITTHPFIDWLKVTQTKPSKNAIGRGETDQITLSLDTTCQILHVKAGNTRAEFKCIDAQEFPAFS